MIRNLSSISCEFSQAFTLASSAYILVNMLVCCNFHTKLTPRAEHNHIKLCIIPMKNNGILDISLTLVVIKIDKYVAQKG